MAFFNKIWKTKNTTVTKTYDKIEFPSTSIYDYLIEEVGDDTDLYALNYFGKRLTYADFFRQINLIAKSLKYLGVGTKDIVTICMPNTPEAVEIFYAINKIGAVVDLIHPLSSKKEIIEYLNKTESRILFLFDENYKKISERLKDTEVEKIVLLSISESMPKITKFIYKVSKNMKESDITNDKYLLWSDFLNLGYLYKGSVECKIKIKDLAIILHSGGTTGTPKNVMISNYSFNALAKQGSINVENIKPSDKILTVLPLFHGFGACVCIHCPLTLKVEVILTPKFESHSFKSIFKKFKPNVLAGVPTLWEALLSDKRFRHLDMSSLKYMISGGDNLPIATEERINEFLKNHNANIVLSKGYGMTESIAATIFTFPSVNKVGSIGVPMVGNEVKICHPTSLEELSKNEEGEICVTGPTLMLGYYKNPEETKNILKKHKDGKTWLHTGDCGYIDDDGLIYFTGRMKRMIVSSGFNIYPTQIESVLLKHPKVKSCCVIGVPHPYKMHVAKAFIILENDTTSRIKVEAELRLLCKENLPVFSYPKIYEFAEELPKTIYNKIDYKKLERDEEEKYERRKK